MNLKLLLRGLLLIASLVAFGFLLEATQLSSALDKSWIDADVRGQGVYGELMFLAVGALFTGFGLPRQIIGFLGGYAFGFAYGSVLAVLATLLGCVLAFYYARVLGRELVAAKFPKRINRLDNFLRDNPLSMTLLIRLLPVGSNLLVNLAAGVSRIGAVAFFLGSAIGYIPQTMAFTLAGSGVADDPGLRISLGVVLFVVSGMIGVYLYRISRHSKAFDDETEMQLSETQLGDTAADGE